MAAELSQTLLARTDVPLSPRTVYSKELAASIRALDVDPNLRAALHLLNDDLDATHNIVQSRDGDATSQMMHALLHRREQDFWNSKWFVRPLPSTAWRPQRWLSQTTHPVIDAVHGSSAKAKDFVDRVARAKEGSAEATACQEVQRREFAALMDHLLL
jgi:hypothetical protein